MYLIVGDLHGDYSSFEKVFEIAKEFEVEKIVFLGDYVDRGEEDYKILYYIYLWLNKQKVFDFDYSKLVFLRGNHEDIEINKVYGFYYRRSLFYNLVGKRMDIQNEIYERLPLYYIEKNFLAIHGSLPCRFSVRECPYIENCKMELLWNDFDPEADCIYNTYRGVGFITGKKQWDKAKKELSVNYLFLGHRHVNASYFDEVYQINSNNITGEAKVVLYDGQSKPKYIDL